MAAFSVMKSIKQRRRIHVRRAPPVDRAVSTDKCDGPAVSQRSVMFQWQETLRSFGRKGAQHQGSVLPPVTPKLSPVM